MNAELIPAQLSPQFPASRQRWTSCRAALPGIPLVIILYHGASPENPMDYVE
jgi:hypothetical protein